MGQRKQMNLQTYALPGKAGKQLLLRGISGNHPVYHLYFFEAGGIEVRVPFPQTIFDILLDFDLYEEETPEGRWTCTLCRDLPDPENPEPLIYYASREELWIKHSFEPLAAWTRKSFGPDTWLCLFRLKGCAWASFARGVDAEEIENRPGFFKKVPVLMTGEAVTMKKD